MKPKLTASFVLVAVFAAFAAVMLSSCVSIPIPPAGEDSGKLGRLEMKLVFVPNVSGTIDYLWKKQLEKPTSSK
jgi:hypothetical protein